MAKPKAPRWLTESFALGIDEREGYAFIEPSGEESHPLCWLAQFDPAHKLCEGRFERFHFVRRQDTEAAIWNQLTDAPVEEWWSDWNGEEGGGGTARFAMPPDWRDELILLAAWDPRNGGIACEAHHRRLDSQLVPLPSEQLIVPYEALPEHVLEFASDYDLTEQLEAKYEPKGEA